MQFFFIVIFCTDMCLKNVAKRIDCGYFNIDKKSCYYRGCCYDNSVNNAPSCFYKRGKNMNFQLRSLQTACLVMCYITKKIYSEVCNYDEV